MLRIRVLIVDGLEVACRLTRALEWIPGWNRIYQCHLAGWSNQLDARWGTGRWPTHGSGLAAWDDWEAWYEGLTDTERDQGHWHAFD
jgi:hypothetical protein